MKAWDGLRARPRPLSRHRNPETPSPTPPESVRELRQVLCAWPFWRFGFAFRSRSGVGTHERDSRAVGFGLHSRCLRFTASVTPTAQDSLAGGGQPYPRGTPTHKARQKDSESILPHVISSPFPRLTLAHTWYLILMPYLEPFPGMARRTEAIDTCGCQTGHCSRRRFA
jgi:hypothetical protein